MEIPDRNLEFFRFEVYYTSLPVVSTGTFSRNLPENVKFIKQISDTGVVAVVLIPSMMVEVNASETTLLNTFESILRQTDGIPLGIYECPKPYHRLVSTEMLDTLQESGRFLYFKDTSCDAVIVDRKIDIVANSTLGIYNAHSPTALRSIRSGGSGISCIAGNFYPELFTYLWKYGREKEIPDSIRSVNNFILTNEPVIANKYPLASKYFMSLCGLDLTINSRTNTKSLDQSDKELLDTLWYNLQYLSDEMNIHLVS